MEHTIVSDSKEVALYILKEWGVSYSTSGIVAWLKRLGDTYQKTTLTPSKHNPADQKACREADEKGVESRFEKEAILFLDGTQPQHNTRVSHAIKTGKTKAIQSNTGGRRVNIHGAYNPLNPDIVVTDDDPINAETTIAFLKK